MFVCTPGPLVGIGRHVLGIKFRSRLVVGVVGGVRAWATSSGPGLGGGDGLRDPSAQSVSGGAFGRRLGNAVTPSPRGLWPFFLARLDVGLGGGGSQLWSLSFSSAPRGTCCGGSTSSGHCVGTVGTVTSASMPKE